MHRHFKISTFGILGEDLPKNIGVLLFAIFVFTIAWGILDPLMPIYLKSMVGNYTAVGAIFAVMNIMIFLASIPIGDLADKTKTIRLIRIAWLFYPLIGIFYAFAAKLWHVIAARAIHGIINPILWVSTEAYIRQNTTKKNNLKAFGWYSTISNIGVIIGSLIGAAIIVFSSLTVSQLFLVLVPFSLVSFSIIYFIKQDSQEKKEGLAQAIEEIVEKDKIYEKEVFDFIKLGKGAFVLAILVFFTAIISNVIYFVIPLLSSEINLGLSGLILMYGFLHLPFAFCFLLVGLADRQGKAQIVLAGLVLITIFLILAFFSTGILALFALLVFLLAFVLALIIPSINSIISDITPNLEVGEMSGMYYGLYCLGGTAGPILFGVIGDLYGLKTVFLASAIITITVFAIAFTARKKIAG